MTFKMLMTCVLAATIVIVPIATFQIGEYVDNNQSEVSSTVDSFHTFNITSELEGMVEDMIIDVPKQEHHRSKRSVKTNLAWDNGLVHYEFDRKFFSGPDVRLITQSMKLIEMKSCVQFVPFSESMGDVGRIFFTVKTCGCCSHVGKKAATGRQDLSLGDNCRKKGIIMHELMHALGFNHEHTRSDRDDYVTVNTQNIQAANQYNFDKNDDSLQGMPYDYASIMHYGRATFSKESYLDSILPKKRAGRLLRPSIGQREKLSLGDRLDLHLLYSCPVCGKTLSGASGTFASPESEVYEHSFPIQDALDEFGMKKYSFVMGDTCQWRIFVSEGEKIYLNFDKFDLGGSCEENFVEVHDGDTNDARLIGRFCSQNPPHSIVSKTSRLLITYTTSQRSPTQGGFEAYYEAVCVGVIQIDQGEQFLSSPSFPMEHPPNTEYEWQLISEPGSQIVLEFETFELENSIECRNDYVEIRDGDAHSRLIVKLCDRKIPSHVTSTSNLLYVKFKSDDTIQRNGFLAKAYKANCGGTFQLTRGETVTVTSPNFPKIYNNDGDCTWTVVAPREGDRILLTFTDFSVAGSSGWCHDKVVINSLSPINSAVLKRHAELCGSEIPEAITSSTNVIQLHFTSDTSTRKTGFAANLSLL